MCSGSLRAVAKGDMPASTCFGKEQLRQQRHKCCSKPAAKGFLQKEACLTMAAQRILPFQREQKHNNCCRCLPECVFVCACVKTVMAQLNLTACRQLAGHPILEQRQETHPLPQRRGPQCPYPITGSWPSASVNS